MQTLKKNLKTITYGLTLNKCTLITKPFKNLFYPNSLRALNSYSVSILRQLDTIK